VVKVVREDKVLKGYKGRKVIQVLKVLKEDKVVRGYKEHKVI
jgi:hypothetical protein